MVLAFLARTGARDVLLVGAAGEEDVANPNSGIVEKSIAAHHPVKMGINVVPAITDYPFMIADARDMPFPDNYVDFALANAIIEHVGNETEQQRMVDEND